jgi:hypothetical protein
MPSRGVVDDSLGGGFSMRRALLGLAFAFLGVASQALALEATATITRVDAEHGVIIVFAGGQDRTLKVGQETQFLDAAGKALPNGIGAAEWKEGVAVTVTVDLADGQPALKAIRLGSRAGGVGPPSVGKPTVGLKPLDEMTAADRYKGEDGGLYGGGRNEPPPALQAAARAETARIVPLDAEGKPAPDGKVVLVSISMSNATQEFSVFKRIADADPAKSPVVTIVDCAQGGQAMAQWVNPQGPPWQEADRRLAAARATHAQVQVAWVKLANIAPTGDLSEHGGKLQKDTVAVLQNAKARFPNLRIAYLGSRIYGGWADGRLNPEPYAYESAFVVRWLIQRQSRGDAELNCEPARGPVKAPLLLWGPYLWADGTTPRKTDGLVYERTDVANDGVHPTDSGRRKVADLLLKFFKTDANAKTWFVKP